MKFRRKPIVVDAVCWFPEALERVERELPGVVIKRWKEDGSLDGRYYIDQGKDVAPIVLEDGKWIARNDKFGIWLIDNSAMAFQYDEVP